MSEHKIKVILIHGNDENSLPDNWLPYVKSQLEQLNITATAKQFPDAPLAHH